MTIDTVSSQMTIDTMSSPMTIDTMNSPMTIDTMSSQSSTVRLQHLRNHTMHYDAQASQTSPHKGCKPHKVLCTCISDTITLWWQSSQVFMVSMETAFLL